MFSQACVKSSVHGRGCIPRPSACWDTHPPTQCKLGYTHPLGRHPPGQTPSPGRHPPGRQHHPPKATAADGTHPTECILVYKFNFKTFQNHGVFLFPRGLRSGIILQIVLLYSFLFCILNKYRLV